MCTIKSIKFEFEKSLKNYFSKNELIAIWNQWVVKEIFSMSLIDYFNKGDFNVDVAIQIRINSLIKHLLNSGFSLITIICLSINSN